MVASDGCSSKKRETFDLRRSSRHCHGAEMDRRAEVKIRSLMDEWISLVKEEGPATEADRRVWLKEKHKLGTNSDWWIAEGADGKGSEEEIPKSYLAMAPKYVDEQYSGKKENRCGRSTSGY
jgi:hypothetical protein